MSRHPRGAGWRLIDRYMPGAIQEEKEAALENLKRLARLIIRVHERLHGGNQ